MIYTVTFNPSLDYIVSVPDFKLGRTNRTSSEKMYPGGKGINVSILLRHLGVDSTALGFCAGFVGDEIVRQLSKYNIRTDFVRLDEGCARINFKLMDVEGTEINGQGPDICSGKLAELYGRLDKLSEGDVLILAGSIPSSMPQDVYARACEEQMKKGTLIVVDATRDLLVNVLKYHPFLVKPNNHELGEIFGVRLCDKASVVPYAKKLREMGAGNVLVSMAGQGAVLVADDGSVAEADAPAGKLVNGVGAGDSMVAGFIAGWLSSHNYEEAFRMGIACGSASAFSEHLADRKTIEEVYESVNIRMMEVPHENS